MIFRNLRISFLLSAASVVLCVTTLYAAPPPVDKTYTSFTFDTTKPISVAADRLEVDNKLQVANFIGNVVAVQDNIMLNSDTVSIHYLRDENAPVEPKDKEADNQGGGLSALTGGSKKIQSVVAAGQVVVIQEKRRATCEQVVFDEEKGTVTLTGDPKLYWGTDMLRGDKIVVHVDTERVEVIGTPGNRVQARVVPKNVKNELPDRAQPRLKELTERPLNPEADKEKKDKKKGEEDPIRLAEPTPDG